MYCYSIHFLGTNAGNYLFHPILGFVFSFAGSVEAICASDETSTRAFDFVRFNVNRIIFNILLHFLNIEKKKKKPLDIDNILNV